MRNRNRRDLIELNPDFVKRLKRALKEGRFWIEGNTLVIGIKEKECPHCGFMLGLSLDHWQCDNCGSTLKIERGEIKTHA